MAKFGEKPEKIVGSIQLTLLYSHGILAPIERGFARKVLVIIKAEFLRWLPEAALKVGRKLVLLLTAYDIWRLELVQQFYDFLTWDPRFSC